jgi:hypothetical protein
MKKLMRTVGVAILVLAGAGGLLLAGAGAAAAQPAGASACQQFFATLREIAAAAKNGAGNAGTSFQSQIDTQAAEMEQSVSSGSPAVKAAVTRYANELKATAAVFGNFSSAKLKADGNAIIVACAAQATAARGAPATGGGSTAAVQDPALFGLGAAAVLAGIGILGLTRRNRPRNSPGHGGRSRRSTGHPVAGP